MNKDGRNNESHDQTKPGPTLEVEHVIRFTTQDALEINLVVSHITGWAIRPPEDKGELWHQEPEQTRSVVLVIHSISMNSTFQVGMSEAKKLTEQLSEAVSLWHEYQFMAPRPMIVGALPPQPRFTMPNGPTFPPARQ